QTFFYQAEGGIRGFHVTGVQTCALPICLRYLAEELEARAQAGKVDAFVDRNVASHVTEEGSRAVRDIALDEPQHLGPLEADLIEIRRASCRERRNITEGRT